MILQKAFFTLFFLTVSAISFAQSPKNYEVISPDGAVKAKITVDDSVMYSLSVDGTELIHPSTIALQTSADNSADWQVKSADHSSHDETLHPVIWQKSSTIRNHYNEFTINFANGKSLQWRIFNDGIGWRWKTDQQGKYKVTGEEAQFNFADGKTWYPAEDGFYSHNERLYKRYPLHSLTSDSLASLPVLTEVNGIKLLLTESSLFDFPGLWVRGTGQGGLKGVHPHYPKQTNVTSDRDEKVLTRENFIAQTEGARSFPWRALLIARNDKDLLNNQLVYKLARPANGNYSWVEPGKVAWDWWNDWNVYDVNFRAGTNTKTYNYYIDFGAKYNLKYMLLDEGWSDTNNLLKVNPDIDMPEIISYAKKKGVDLLLWVPWLALDHQMDQVLDQYADWGVKGIKVDFMQRDDQQMVNFYQRVAEAAAKRHLLVDFHGAYKPTGWIRTYPNVLTSEGVFGNEHSKWTDLTGPKHNITIPFIRMAAGPMDFTPGGMRNTHKDTWAPVNREPMTIGTRANQLAMYVMYESPLQMLCDTPTHYYHAPKAMDFLSKVPTVWQQTVPLQAEVGNYGLIARQAPNGDWYIAAMTDDNPRKLTTKLSFLDQDVNYQMMVWKDGINADHNAKDMAEEQRNVTANSTITINMVHGGGWVAKITKK